MWHNIIVLIFAVTAFRAAADETVSIESDKEKARAIIRRVENQKENEALNEIASLHPSVAIPILGEYALDRTTNPEQAQIAITALRNIEGLGEYFQKRLSKLSAKPGGAYNTVKDFDILAVIGNTEAVWATAQFLFDKSPVVQLQDDYSVDPIRWQAVRTLARMKLTNAPTSKQDYELSETDVQQWCDWAVAKGLVPTNLNNGGKPNESVPAVPTNTPETSLASSRAVSPPSSDNSKPTSVVVSDSQMQLWLWAVGIVSLVVLAVLVLKRRK